MRAEQRIEGGELEPAHIQLARVILSGHEAADIASPIRDAAEARVDGDRNVRLQSLPSRLHIAGPQEGSESLHTGVAVSMQRVDAFIRAIHLVTLEVHSIPGKARRRVEPVPLIGPPAVHAEIEERVSPGHPPLLR